MSDLEDRGYLDESRGNVDPYLEGGGVDVRPGAYIHFGMSGSVLWPLK